MNELWTVDDLAKAMGARRFGSLPEAVSGVSIDTRTIEPGEAFFAIKGDRFDGHDFVTQAMKAGAGLAVVAEERLVAMGGVRLPFLVVGDVLDALRKLGEAARARSRAQIVAITGSVGKTTSKEMLRTVLAASGKVHASAASFNNHWGVPLTLARMPPDTRFGVFEIGMNHAGEITPLVAMVKPHVAIVTTIAPAHLGSFDSVEGIARAKAEIFTGVVEGGLAILNRDNEHFGLLRDLAGEAGVQRIATFGRGGDCDFRLAALDARDGGSDVRAVIGGETVEYRLPVPGEHIAFNSLPVLGAAQAMGADMERSLAAIAGIAAAKGRGQQHRVPLAGGTLTVIDESYNANPASMEAALKVLAGVEPGPGGRRIAVLGDMLELGASSAALHAALKEPLEASGAQAVWLAGPEMAALAEVLPRHLLAGHFATAKELGEALADVVKGGDVVMLKASNGLGFSALVDKLLGSGAARDAAVR